MKAFSQMDREGTKRSFHVRDVNAKTLRPSMQEHMAELAALKTDEAGVYKKIGKDFDWRDSVTHSHEECVNKIRPWIDTNTVESSFSILKRGLVGTFHHAGEQHLQRYVNELDFRWSYRTKLGANDTKWTALLLKDIEGKRLTYWRSDQA